jgi:hypothetical protein
MLLNKSKVKIGVGDILLLIVTVLYAVGIRVWFPVCDKMTSMGTYMTCHWVGEILKVLSIVLIVLAVFHIVIPSYGFKAGIDVAVLLLFAVIYKLPGGIVNLCKMDTMNCVAHTKPSTVIYAIIGVLIAVFDLAVIVIFANKEKHKRV